MSKELTTQSNLMIVTRQDMEAQKAQKALLKEFVSGQLVEAQFKDEKAQDYGDGDFGIIPGTKKKVLLKPGAEKLLQLFNLGARFKLVNKEVDKDMNFAMYEYECEIFSRRTGNVISTCIGTTNSQEKKWKSRTVWEKGEGGRSKSRQEETPIFDVLNTLSKMAQKRALIGATILATAASDFFTQDLEPEETERPKEKDVTPKEPVKAEAAPECCGKPMMVSKYPDKDTGEFPLYCPKCKNKVTQAAS